MDRRVVWIRTRVSTPPFSPSARVETGVLLRRLQRGERLSMPQNRPMPSIGTRCHELRIPDADASWRLVYRVDYDAILVLDVFSKKSESTPTPVIERCRKRLREYDIANRNRGA